MSPDRSFNKGSSALLMDLYELTMMQAYHQHGVVGTATFDLFVRRLPPERNFLVVGGLTTVLDIIEEMRFGIDDVEYLASTGIFDNGFLERLVDWGFSGNIDAMPEGTVAFAGEPILRVTAPIAEAQALETIIMNQLHVATLLASKAARVVISADGKSLVDFGLRRMHGTDAGLAGARSCWIAGFDATSNVLAGRTFGIPVAGTMAHSFVQCFESEGDALRRFVTSFPGTIVLVDTYDTLQGIDAVIALTRELGDAFDVRGVRLDSGDLDALAREARERLDAAGLERIEIFVSGNLDEYGVERLVGAGAPIDGFGVGTRLGTSEDAPNLDIVYKLAQLDDRPVLKLSTHKATLPGIKQVWRLRGFDGSPVGDVIGLVDEDLPGEPLLVPAMRGGRKVDAGIDDLDTIRDRAARELACLGPELCALSRAEPAFPVEVSDRLRQCRDRLAEQHGERRSRGL
jgi:nicotinate phosphoribosyltransferase